MSKVYVVVVVGCKDSTNTQDTLCNFEKQQPYRFTTTDKNEAYALAKRLAANHGLTYYVLEQVAVVESQRNRGPDSVEHIYV